MNQPNETGVEGIRCGGCPLTFHGTTKQRESYAAGKTVFCSRTCQRASKHVKVPCAGCGDTLERYRSQIERSKTGLFFCSEACRNAVGSKPRRGDVRTCEKCGAPFYASPSSTQRFCGKTCVDQAQLRQTERTCPVCETAFTRARSEPDIYCSVECFRARPRTSTRKVGDRKINSDGYAMIFVPDHVKADMHGFVPEHRLAMEWHLGRHLLPHENVHHLNGQRDDNQLANLELWTKSQPSGQRVVDKVAWARELLAIYEPLGY